MAKEIQVHIHSRVKYSLFFLYIVEKFNIMNVVGNNCLYHTLFVNFVNNT